MDSCSSSGLARVTMRSHVRQAIPMTFDRPGLSLAEAFRL